MTMFFGVLLARVIGLHLNEGAGRAAVAGDAAVVESPVHGDGAPALGARVDPVDPRVMSRPPAAQGERVITGPACGPASSSSAR